MAKLPFPSPRPGVEGAGWLWRSRLANLSLKPGKLPLRKLCHGPSRHLPARQAPGPRLGIVLGEDQG